VDNWGHSPRKSICFSIRAVSAYWGYLTAKALRYQRMAWTVLESRRRAACAEATSRVGNSTQAVLRELVTRPSCSIVEHNGWCGRTGEDTAPSARGGVL